MFPMSEGILVLSHIAKEDGVRHLRFSLGPRISQQFPELLHIEIQLLPLNDL